LQKTKSQGTYARPSTSLIDAQPLQCDEERPSCLRCLRRNEVCTGYRDDASLIFRDMTEKTARASIRRRNSTSTMSRSSPSTHSTGVSPLTNGTSVSDDSDLLPIELSGLRLSSPYPWAKAVPESSVPSPEDQAVSQFFEKFVMYPCNSGSSPGFLEHLPTLFIEVKMEGRMALRWAVRAASYASLSSDQNNAALRAKALSCYGKALSALGESLADPNTAPDGFTLMTVVILDLFEVCRSYLLWVYSLTDLQSVYLQEQGSRGSHAEGMAQLLRLRGPDQIYGSRGWSLFRLAHHRLQRQQLGFRQAPLPESEAWLDSLNDDLPYVRIEKDNFQISKICERARNLLARLDSSDLSIDQTLDMVKEIHDLDQVAASWRHGPDWAHKTIHHSEISQGEEAALQLPEYIQLHHDVWIAYEWNYHRTARIIMHEHLLECLYKLHNLHVRIPGEQSFPISECFMSCKTWV
jgi:hypothetical protein